MIEIEYSRAFELFKLHEKSFKQRKDKIKNISFSEINWSDSYLDFSPYDSMINQLEIAKIFKEERLDSVRNHFLDGKLIHSYKNQNEGWGSIFIDYENNYKLWLLFVENDDDEMLLQQLRVAHHKNEKITKTIFYLLDKDDGEETFMFDLYNYDNSNRIKKITRNGFYNSKSRILPVREISFTYTDNRVQIYSKQKTANPIIHSQLIYDGKPAP